LVQTCWESLPLICFREQVEGCIRDALVCILLHKDYQLVSKECLELWTSVDISFQVLTNIDWLNGIRQNVVPILYIFIQMRHQISIIGINKWCLYTNKYNISPKALSLFNGQLKVWRGSYKKYLDGFFIFIQGVQDVHLCRHVIFFVLFRCQINSYTIKNPTNI